ncbi:MAG: hypothetical protein ACFE95_09740 [Candidatus Hodarchaeota archaeon]
MCLKTINHDLAIINKDHNSCRDNLRILNALDDISNLIHNIIDEIEKLEKK